jgi:hypothetical protein
MVGNVGRNAFEGDGSRMADANSMKGAAGEPSANQEEPSVSRRGPFAHALLFTGHMIDKADRKEPRFPAWAEGRARAAIRAAVAGLPWERPGQTIGLAGGASGGDILFHEVCAELGIATRLFLAMPVEKFVNESVAPGGPEWVRRFHALLEAHDAGNVCVMGERDGVTEGATANIWQRANLWMIEEAVALAAERTLLALWDGSRGDGPGGTEYFVQTAPRFGIRVASPIEMQSILRS